MFFAKSSALCFRMTRNEYLNCFVAVISQTSGYVRSLKLPHFALNEYIYSYHVETDLSFVAEKTWTLFRQSTSFEINGNHTSGACSYVNVNH